MSYTYPRESVEYVFFDEITVNGVIPGLPLEFSLTPDDDRPTVWKNITVVNGRFAFLLDGTLPPNDYQVWVRIPSAPETSVIRAGQIRIS